MNAFKTFTVTLTNTGSQTWNAAGTNPIHLAWYFGNTTSSDLPNTWTTEPVRASLPSDVAPGQTVNVSVTVAAPTTASNYILRLRLVKEGVKWFDQIIKSNVTVDTLAATYASTPPTTVHAGQILSYNVTVTNTGTSTWVNTGPNVYHLGVYFAGADDSVGAWPTEPLRFNLPTNVAAGASVIVPVTITAPADGTYVLRNRMVEEGVAWFAQMQKTNVIVNSVAPTVTSVTPANGATGVAIASSMTGTFSAPMNPTTINSSTITLVPQGGGAAIPATVIYNPANNSFTITPTSPLAIGTFSITILGGASGVIDVSGNALASTFTSSFTTAPNLAVIGVTPANGSTGNTSTTAVTITFSKAMNPSFITSSTLTLMNGSTLIPTTVSYSAATNTATLTPTTALLVGTYTVTVVGGSAGIRDFWGNQLPANNVTTFSTVAPTVASITPANAATLVAPTATVNVLFSAAMNPATINTSTILLKSGATLIAATVSYNAATKTATLTPTAPLAIGAFTITVVGGASGVKDPGGNPLTTTSTSTFTTATALAATYVGTLPTAMTTNLTQTFVVTLINTGSQTWNATGTNPLHLAWYFGSTTSSDSPNTWTTEPIRVNLPNDVAPGASVNVSVTVTPPTTAGNYILRLRLVKEGVQWFSQLIKSTVSVTLPALGASYAATMPTTWNTSQSQTIAVTLINTGSTTWITTGANPFHLAWYWGSTTSSDAKYGWASEPIRINLTHNVLPGQSITINVPIAAPTTAGSYILRFRMVQEGVDWFNDLYKATVTITTPPLQQLLQAPLVKH